PAAIPRAIDAETFDYTDSSRTSEETFHFMGFEFLHRLNIVRLQTELISMKDDIFREPKTRYDHDKLDKLLSKYSNAIRNYNYVHEAHQLDHNTSERRKQRLKHKFSSIVLSPQHTPPFESHYYYLHDNSKHPAHDTLREKLRQMLPSSLSYSANEKIYRRMEFEEGLPPVEISPFVDKLVRLLVALLAVTMLVERTSLLGQEPHHFGYIHGSLRWCCFIWSEDFECGNIGGHSNIFGSSCGICWHQYLEQLD
ncbi:hypothetical protein PG996_005293, partial [Apiospora saccharicola]